MSHVHSEEYKEAIRRIDRLHGNMAVLARLNIMLRDTNTDLSDITRLIQSDGPLSATIIRLSNSVYYGSSERSKDVFSALRKVGMNEAQRLVSMALSRQVFMRDLNAYGILADDYWRYSYCCAVYMDVASRRHGLDSSQAFLSGLLHAVGRVLINELIHDQAVEIYWDPNLDPEVWEDVMVGMRFPEAGAVLLENWGFSEEVVQAVRTQLDSHKTDEDMLRVLLDFIRKWCILNRAESSGAWMPIRTHPYLDKSGLESDQLECDLKETLRTVNAVHEMLKSC